MAARRATLAGIAFGLTVAAVGVLAKTSSPPLARAEGRATPAPGPLYALSHRGEDGTLARVDPVTLRRTARPIALGRFASGGAFSPAGTRLAVFRETSSKPSLRAALRVLDLRTRRLGPAFVVPHLRYGLRLIAWLRSDRIVLLREDELSVVDPARRRVLRTVSLEGSVVAVERAGDSLVLLLARTDRIAPATLAVANADGALRRVALAPIPAGFLFDENGDRSGTGPTPGLAVDPDAGRAYVVGGGTPVAEVRLADLAVSYHDLTRPISLLGRLHDWLEPAAQAKFLEGPQRWAVWLGNGLLAVAGSDESSATDGQGRPAHRSDPAGLHVVDTRSWTTRTLSPSASGAVWAGGALVTVLGDALVALEPGGGERWRLPTSGLFHVGVFRTHGSFLYLPRRSRPLAVVDARTGNVLTTTASATTLLSPGVRPS